MVITRRILLFKRTMQTTGEYLVRLDLLRRKAESKMQIGGAYPATFASVLCMQNVPFSRPDKSQGVLGVSAVARQMRRLFGPRRGAAR